MHHKKALITGATGQDAAWLTRLLLEKNYEVYLTDRRVSAADNRFWRLKELGIFEHPNLHIIHATLECYESLYEAVKKVHPDEVYSLAANSFVTDSFLDEHTCFNINFLGVHRLLRACQKMFPRAKFYQASSSEQFGKVEAVPQSESTRFHPRSPYGVSKTAAFELVRHYRERGFFACNGILFNHEGPLRGEEFVTRKITKGAVAAIAGGPKIQLGNLEAKRDFGSAKDYVEGMSLMLQHTLPDDYVLATGETHSIREFLEETFRVLSELEGIAYDYKDFIEINEKLYRPTEVDLLLGDASKAKQTLGWEPKTNFKQLVAEMVQADHKRYHNRKLPLFT